MTDTTMPNAPIAGLLDAFVWLPRWRRRRRQAAHLDTLSDRMLADIGMERDAIDRMGINTLHAAMRFSG